ncbi:glycosyltransferase [Aeromonas bestiarum]|uniref:glycosyltransferase n=1 Tax=Aeromonas bestiarum TaxID=105751 RepID=UPI0009B8D948|nr:glycosyltransferase [Aeromonas bestiarum]
MMKVTIITATWNSENKLQCCLDSVAQQSAIENIEHIIVDGRSSDSTIAIASQYPHISKIISAKDRGIYHAFNRGLELATGVIVYFLGSDDSLHDYNVISDVLEAFSPEVNYYLGSVLCEDSVTGNSYLTRSNNDHQVNFRPCHQGFFCRRELFERFGNFNECFTIGADMYLMKMVIKETAGVKTNRPIARFSLQGLSSTSDNQALVIRQHEMIDILIDGDTVDSELPDLLAQQRNTNTLLKNLLQNLLKNKIRLDASLFERVAVFGTRDMSQIISMVLRQYEIETLCFVVSEIDYKYSVDEIPVVCLSELSGLNLDTIINCIEGQHESEITDRIHEADPGITVISWRSLCN